jgi:nucleotide-binding universal stress UspA family protein
MKKILVPVDFSQQSQDALDVAHQLAKKLKAHLQLVHVLEIPLPDDEVPVSRIEVLPMEYMRRAKEGAIEQLEALVKQQHISDVKIDYQVQSGNPYRSIIRELVKNPVDLIVMGSKGASGDKEVWVGSNAERMVRLAHCPVLVVKEKFPVDRIKNIVFATALREYEPEALHELKELQKAFGAHLHLLRVNTIGNFMEDPFVKERLRELADTHQLKNYTIRTYSDIEEEDGIIHYAEEVKADMIAMTTRGRRGLMHLLSGSKAEDVTNHTRLPVWTMNLRYAKHDKKQPDAVLTEKG